MLKVKEKIAYGLGDTASNIIFQTVMMFSTHFLYRCRRFITRSSGYTIFSCACF